jgi:hypothetical protein
MFPCYLPQAPNIPTNLHKFSNFFHIVQWIYLRKIETVMHPNDFNQVGNVILTLNS